MSRAGDTPPSGGRRKPRRAPAIPEALRERAAAMERFGYRPLDGAFLAAAALLGGYFLRRQYRDFAQCKRGRREVSLLRLAERNCHLAAAAGKALYRLRGKALYLAAGCRAAARPRARRGIKQRLLALDRFIALRHERDWLLSADDKSARCASLGIAAEQFPRSARKKSGKRTIFPDGLPMRLDRGGSPAMVFCYAHAGATEAAMRRHLEMHEQLAAALASAGIACRWEVLADSRVQFPRLRRAWRLWIERLQRDWSEGEYFELRQAVERQRWSSLTRESVGRYAALVAAHAKDRGTKRRYRAWLQRGAPGRPPGPCPAATCSYREILLDHDYAAADAVRRPR